MNVKVIVNVVQDRVVLISVAKIHVIHNVVKMLIVKYEIMQQFVHVQRTILVIHYYHANQNVMVMSIVHQDDLLVSMAFVKVHAKVFVVLGRIVNYVD